MCTHAAIYARGMCVKCYHRAYRRRAKVSESLRGRTYNYTPPELVLPLRPEHVLSYTFTSTGRPQECPKCRRTYALIFDGREAHCDGGHGGCGWTAYEVRVPAQAVK